MFYQLPKLTRPDDLLELVKKEPFNESKSYKVTYYGTCDYVYTRACLKAKKFPDYLGVLSRQMERTLMLPQGYFNMALLNMYPSGKGLGRHRDDEPEITKGSVIVSVSLGAMRVFSITKGYKNNFLDVELNHGDVWVMDGDAQINYWHAVLPGLGERWNITLRHNNNAPRRM